MILDIAMQKQLAIRSTPLRRKRIHKSAWMSLERKSVNQIDHVLIERKDIDYVPGICSMRGAQRNLDHYLVGITCESNWERRT